MGHYGLVCITRSGADIRKFIYETDVLYKNQVSLNSHDFKTSFICFKVSAKLQITSFFFMLANL